ncbi:molybdate transport system ATP-binding protein [Tepidamorphus gemmatus]|uniref:Molybdate transport system ATP-binding protein n=1 Tax=Tepidamorphus gemmatus TaxID=747076 RepID=A0A4R3M814_9HYPH|nr:ABC transporter ATP-binding protein [Tepidamorphus gemmatus]TCT09232.1 molybdate transport system ATP-binding protein [Tepidamorphus gemmatus]
MTAAGGLHVELAQDAPIPLDARFAVAPGEVLALVGPSGSGKSTILRSIAGLYHPARGRIAVDGETWFDPARRIRIAPHRRRVGLVFQSYALFPHMSALDNVAAALGPGIADPAGRARQLLATVHLDGLESRRPAELSGGQQQRVAVARALARDPKVLLLDEPFSAVDRVTRKRLYREIAELRHLLAMPTVLVTHDLDEAVRLADRIAVLDRGRILQTGSVAEITTRPASPAIAGLVDLRNLFEATVLEHRPAEGRTFVDWSGIRLATPLRSDLAVGDRASWVIPEGFVVLVGDDGHARRADGTLVRGTAAEVLQVGQAIQVVLRVAGTGHRLHVLAPLHVARRERLEPGVEVSVLLLAEGIHLMVPAGPDRPGRIRPPLR